LKVFIDAPLLIYLNTMAEARRRIFEDFYIDLIIHNKPYTDVLILDEIIYVSRPKYGVPYELSLEFIDSIVAPYVSIVGLGEEEYQAAASLMREYGLKPSDALHLAAARSVGIETIVSEDREFDRIPWVRRIWL
jgi:predicted nucleic acid-binding protein